MFLLTRKKKKYNKDISSNWSINDPTTEMTY